MNPRLEYTRRFSKENFNSQSGLTQEQRFVLSCWSYFLITEIQQHNLLQDLIKGLLTCDHTKRLGTLKRGVQDILKHKYYQGIDWNVLLEKKIPAPIPVRVGKDGDSRYFDRYPESPQGQLKPLTAAQQELFRNFQCEKL